MPNYFHAVVITFATVRPLPLGRHKQRGQCRPIPVRVVLDEEEAPPPALGTR